MKGRTKARERRRGRATLGAHPERRSLAPARREALRRLGAGPRVDAVVLPPVVNLYERADDASPVVSQVILGTTLALLETRRLWALVETPDRYRGWMRARALRHLARGRGRYPDGGRAVEVIGLLANVYRDPDVTTAAPIATAPMLARIEVMGEGEEWIRVRLPDGREGWLQRGDARPADASPGAGGPADGGVAAPRPDPQAVTATALRFLGLPYLWGGTTTFGLDCSGLVQLAYRAHGYLLPRDADLQWADPNLEEVSRDGIRAGDLVFFGPDAASITHVGIALGADSFVNATTYRAPTVRIDRLDDPYWENLYRGARRIRG